MRGAWHTAEERARSYRLAVHRAHSAAAAALAAAAGHRAMAACCGSGPEIRWLAAKVGPLGAVFAVDRNSDALAVLRERLETWGTPQVRVMPADVTDLPDDVRHLDRILVAFGLHLLAVPQALRHWSGRSVPGARLVSIDWGPTEPVPQWGRDRITQDSARRDDRPAPDQCHGWQKLSTLTIPFTLPYAGIEDLRADLAMRSQHLSSRLHQVDGWFRVEAAVMVRSYVLPPVAPAIRR